MKYRNETDFVVIEKLPVSDVKRISIEILRLFVDFCNKNNLSYYLVGGTLIGAVRHGGFVPWDDDLDVCMPRKDFERFRVLMAENDNKLGIYEYRNIYNCPQLHCRPIDRIVDTRYMCKLITDQYYLPPWIDILPWDGLPSDAKENEEHWKRVQKYKARARRARTPVTKDFFKKRLKRLYKNIVYFPYKLIGPAYFVKQIEEEAKKYDFDACEYGGTVVGGYGRKERMPKWYFIDKTMDEQYTSFEGIECRIPSHPDLILRHMYGDYLTIPKKKKRKTHIVKFWRVDKEKKG